MILVTGATGAAGSAVVREFGRRGLRARVLVRNPAKLAGLGPASGVEVVHGDMGRPETLEQALDGVKTALLISSPDQNLVKIQRAFIDAARRAGIRHIVKMSGRGCHLDSEFRFARMHAEIEQHLERSGIAWTHLRPSQFMHTYLREAATIADEGVLRLPMANARLAPIAVEDIAKVTVSVLHSAGHEGKRFEMTGPQALTMTEIAQTLSEALGVSVRYIDEDPQRWRTQLLEQGLTPFFADALDELFRTRRKNLDESVVDLSALEEFEVDPTSFASFVRQHARAFLGEVAAGTVWSSGWQPNK